LSGDRRRLCEIQRVLTREGLIFIEFKGLVDRVLKRRGVNNLVSIFGEVKVYWLTPFWGEMHTAIPADDGKVSEYFLDNKLYSPSFSIKAFLKVIRSQKPSSNGQQTWESGDGKTRKKPRRKLAGVIRAAGQEAQEVLEKIEQLVLRYRPFARRYGMLIGQKTTASNAGLPLYLRSLAYEAGMAIDDYRWGLVARGDYGSRKVLFFLFNYLKENQDTNWLKYIVKMVRDPIFNPRLENEYRALSWLHNTGIGKSGRIPQVVFFGHHHDLAILGETAIQGAPFKQKTRWTPVCSYLNSALDWLIDLSAETFELTSVSQGQVSEVLKSLFERFLRIYQLSATHQAFILEQISRLDRCIEPFPLVFQHGDPGTWNAIVTPQGDVVFLDWEAAELQGMPLWDLFYFMRSYSVGVARARGIGDRLAGFQELFIGPSELSSVVIKKSMQYCQRIKLDHALIEPLFYTCWMHRALKESARLPLLKLENGHYVNLLRLCIDQRGSPTLNQLFKTKHVL